jgi:TorA maturation chaperone TorD
MGEVFRALAVLAEPPSAESRAVAHALAIPRAPDAQAYTELFTLTLYPYASVYLGAEGMLGGEARDRIAGFWRAVNVVPPQEPDHLAALLGAYASLEDREVEASDPIRRASWSHARSAFLHEHLLSWLPPYLVKVSEIAPAYGAWARLLRDALANAAVSSHAMESVPSQFREVPALADPREDGVPAFIASVLAPARSGIILTRPDLQRASRELGLGLRQGERRFALEAMLAQDPPRVLAWLNGETQRWVEMHRASIPVRASREHWIERALQTAALLSELSATL